MRVRMQPITIATKGEPGWLVLIDGHLVAVLSSASDGKVVLEAGFEEPWTGLPVFWPSLAAAEEQFRAYADGGVADRSSACDRA